MQEIQANHLSNPEVEYQLVRVLDRFGIGPDRGPIRGGAQAAAAPQQVDEPAAVGGTLWTPESGTPAPATEPVAATEPEEKSSGLWIPE